VPGHFQANPMGRSPLPIFLRCSLGLGATNTGAHSRLEKSAKFHTAYVSICWVGYTRWRHKATSSPNIDVPLGLKGA